jgi:hypothetical protein
VLPVFVVVKEGTGPVPLEIKPILALVFVHEYTVPETLRLLVKLTVDVGEPTQTA